MRPTAYLYVFGLGAVFLILVAYSEYKGTWTIQGLQRRIQSTGARKDSGVCAMPNIDWEKCAIGSENNGVQQFPTAAPFNIASELPMAGNFDIAGNPYGIELDCNRDAQRHIAT